MPIEAAETSSRSAEGFWTALLNQSFLRAFFSKKIDNVLSRERKHQHTDTPEVQREFGFDLLNVLIELVQEMNTNPKNAQKYLHSTLVTQLEAALSEHIQLPFHTTFSEVDLDRYVLDDEVFIFHPGYRKVDLIEYTQNAVVAERDPDKKTRYERERKQLEHLYTVLKSEIESVQSNQAENRSSWQEVEAKTTLSARVLHDAGVLPTEQVFVARKHALAMPKNLKVYSEGLSYLNIYQLVYVPSQGRMFLAMDHLYEDLTPVEQARALEMLAQEKKSVNLKPTPDESAFEEQLMSLLSSLDAQTSLSLPLHIFTDLVTKIKQERVGGEGGEFLLKTFQKQNEVKTRFTDLQQTAEFLYKILTVELMVCQQHPSAISGIRNRLTVALEMALHPLFSGNTIQMQASFEVYRSTYLQKWLGVTEVDAVQLTKVQPTLLDQLQAERQRKVAFRGQDQQQRELAIQELAKSYPSILKQIASQAQCAAGSFGGLSKAMNFEVLTSNIMKAPLRDFGQLSSIIGAKRAEEWKTGKCINPDCRFAGQEQLVGECGLCLACELEMSGFPTPEVTEPSGLGNAVGNIFGGEVGSIPHYLRGLRVVHETDFLTYMWSGRDMSSLVR